MRGVGLGYRTPRALRTSPSVTRPSVTVPPRTLSRSRCPRAKARLSCGGDFPRGSASCGLHALGDFLPTGYAIPSFEVEATNEEAHALCGEEVR